MSIVELQKQINKHIESIHSELDLKMLLERVNYLHFSKNTDQLRLLGLWKDTFGKLSCDFKKPLDFLMFKHK